MKAGKFYCHIEDVEPNFTTPFAIEPGLTFDYVASNFCAKYNTKHGQAKQLDPSRVQFKVGSKEVDPSAAVADHVSAGDDVFVLGQGAELPGAGAAQAPSAPPPAAAPAAQQEAAKPPSQAEPEQVHRPVATPLAKKIKVYVHYESAVSEQKDPTATTTFHIEDADMTIGSLIEDFVAKYNGKHAETPLEVMSLCARTDSQVVVQPDVKVCKAVSNGDDLWIVPLSVAMKEDNSTIGAAELPENTNAIDKSKLRAKDKSYYYWAHKPAGEEPAPREAPKQIRKREARADEIIQFKTIAKYAFESEDAFVKVYITLPGVGDLPPEGHEFECQERSMSFRIFNYQGFNHRLQVPKLSEEIIPAQSSVRIKKDMVIIKLAKVKKEHHWYELHKTKGIGED